MPRRIIGSVVGALAAASLVAPVAHAGAPAKVSVRAEAPGRTLADATVTTTRAQVKPDGAHGCSGTSAGGALWQATHGGWSGTWFDSFGDFTVDAIDGVRGPADFSAYWAFWLNGKLSTKGVCGTELQAGDTVLEFLCTSTPDFSSCTNLPLELQVVRPRGTKVVVKVVLLKGDGTSTPVAGATVAGGAQAVRTGADGRATVALRLGQSTLRATHAGDVPSGRLHCVRGAHGGRCGSADRTPPALTLKGIADGQAFDAAHAPRVLRGTARDPEGASVTLRLTRRLDGRCTRFDADRGAFRPCARAPRAPFDAGDRATWSFLLPQRLGAGSYRLDAIATDGAGNRRVLHVRFTVAG
ncbi:MAG: DUF4430 domain-containing protein [Actinobacteria bacterium]|nr:DUF4430 domain-containing protein [Actinomycetota bacterium]